MRWQFATGGAIESPPVIARNGLLLVTSGDGHLYAIGE
ncbi:MAG: PQQ-binding-like beta-propeller repeat protein [Armatimonadetes bacterium]|nr:PQQ-binding-like beta-propeller repeat protein [Armatimonadota bacterium]